MEEFKIPYKKLEKYSELPNFRAICADYEKELENMLEKKRAGSKIYAPESTAFNIIYRRYRKQFKAIEAGIGPIPPPEPPKPVEKPKPSDPGPGSKKLFDISIFKN